MICYKYFNGGVYFLDLFNDDFFENKKQKENHPSKKSEVSQLIQKEKLQMKKSQLRT